MGPETICVNFLIQKDLGPTKIVVQNFFFDPKMFQIQDNFGQKQIWVKKYLRQAKFWSKYNRAHISLSPNKFRPPKSLLITWSLTTDTLLMWANVTMTVAIS